MDVRDLVDTDGNCSEQIEKIIQKGVCAIQEGRTVIVCCDYGISRSNAIAAGILSKIKNQNFDKSLHEIIQTTGESEIKINLTKSIRNVIEGGIAPKINVNNIFVTGGNGFLGSHLVKYLSQHGMNIHSPSSSELNLLTDRSHLDMQIRSHGISKIIHLANPRIYTSNFALGNTLVMLRNVLEVSAINQIPIIFLSSWEIYSGYRAAKLIANESLPPLPIGPYGETKFLCESLIEHFRKMHGLKCTIIRSSPIYGYGSDRPKFLHTFIEKTKKGEAIATHKYRNGLPALDLLHVSDAIIAIYKALNKSIYDDFNIGTGIITTTRQIAKWIVDWLKTERKINSIFIDKEIGNIAMDYSKATDLLGWQPEISIENGLRPMVSQKNEIH